MANILPPDSQQALARTYRSRFILAGALVALALALFAVLALAPSFFALWVTNAVFSASYAAPISADVTADRAAVAHAQQLALALSSLAQASSTATEALSAALVARPAGVKISHITYTGAQKSGASTITLTGTALSPDAVNSYRQALSNTGQFTDVSVPVGALAGANNGNFTMTLTGAF